MGDTGRVGEMGEIIGPRPKRKETVFIALPNLGEMQVGLTRRLLDFINGPYGIYVHFETGNRHHDFARNRCVTRFKSIEADWLLFIDSDVVPPEHALTLIDTAKKNNAKIVAGSVFCYVKDNLMPSIWIKSPCEECANLKAYQETGKPLDETVYRVQNGSLFRWNPFFGIFREYATPTGILNGQKCRCLGTGNDPWTFKVHPKITTLEPFECDSVGAALLLIHREVFDKMPFPWFRHLYKESGEIMLTEDHFFTWQAKALGFSVWAHPQIVCSHVKQIDLFAVNNLLVKAYGIGKEVGAKGGESTIITPTPEDVARAEASKLAV